MLKLFTFPHFSNPETQRRASILVATQVAAVVMMVLIVGISFVLAPDHPEVLLQGAAGATAVILSFILLKKGKLEIAGWIIVILGWLVLTLDLAFISGIRGVNVLGQVLIVILAGFAISGKSALIITGISLVANLIVLNLEQSGIMVEPAPLLANITRYSIQSLYMALAAIYIWRTDTAVKKAFKETQANVERYRALFDRTNDGVFILDLDWCVLNSNSQGAELLADLEPNLVGLNFSHRVGGNDKIDRIAYLNDILTGSDLPVFENMLQQENGSEIPVEISLALVPDPVGDPHHIQCIVRDITERKEYERRLVFQTLHDPLTNLPNRKYLEDQFLNINNRRLDDNRLVAVLFIDIDDFKNVNDQFGHHNGDLVLKELGTRLQRSVRDSDTVARMGGDEFIIVLDDIRTKENVIKVAEKIISCISDPFQIQDHTIMITVSIGISFTEKSNMVEVDLIKTSDAALYMVKEDGKNNFRFYDPKTPA
jgi:diguanylate cyclase (GGDEF)-like protein/PAS domain S-box-containing protein